VPYSDLERLVRGSAGERLEAQEPFDVYQGAQVGAGRRSVALRMRFRHPERALTDDEVDRDMANVMAALVGAGYDIRR
jgi:phenylalanyl-tRNA synthetase beta chain